MFLTLPNLVLVVVLVPRRELPRLLVLTHRYMLTSIQFNSVVIIASIGSVLLHFFGLGSNSRASAFIIVVVVLARSSVALARTLLDAGEVMRQGFRRRAAAAATDSAAMLAPVALPIVWMG